MNPTTLQALIIDRHCGELSPEAIELLDHYLAQHPDARAQAELLRATLSITEQAVLRHPELVVRTATRCPDVQRKAHIAPWLLRAAAVLALTATGFLAGRATQTPASLLQPQTTARTPLKNSPWAKYRMAVDRKTNALQFVRIDTPPNTP
jgi:anti-sigma factor RsiW